MILQPSFPNITIQGATSPRMARTSLDIALSFMAEMIDEKTGINNCRQVSVSYSELYCQVYWTSVRDIVVQWSKFPFRGVDVMQA